MTQSVYTPSRWGEIFHNLPHWEALGAGSAGPGKSLVLLMDPFMQIAIESERQKLPPSHRHYVPPGRSKGEAWHFRRTYKNLSENIKRAKEIFPFVDPGVKWNEQDKAFTFSCGYLYRFLHCKDPDDWQGMLSQQCTHMGFDELVEFDEEQYMQLKNRCRTTDLVLAPMLRIRAMSNPMMRRTDGENFAVKDPHWVRRRFVDPHPKGNKTIRKKIVLRDSSVEYLDRIYLPATLWHNPDKTFVRIYETRLRDNPPHIQRALLFGDWYVTSDSFFGESWNPNLHIIRPFRIPQYWRRFRSMDWGFKTFGCVHWYAVDEDDNLYVEKELSFKGKTDLEVADEIERYEKDNNLWDKKRNRSKLTGPADTQLWEERGDTGVNKATAFAQRGIAWVPADKSRAGNALKVVKRLKDHHNGTTVPGLVFFESCKMAIRTIPGMPINPDHPDEPAKNSDDHWYDGISYGVAFASRKNGIPAHATEEEDIWRDEPKSDKKQRGRYGYGQELC